jgi:hypothetical protein
LAKHLYLFGGWVDDDGAQKQKRIANISYMYMYVVGWSSNLKWENLEFATLLRRWVGAYLKWGILEFATFLCMQVSANLRWGNLGFATFYVCIWVGTKLQA